MLDVILTIIEALIWKYIPILKADITHLKWKFAHTLPSMIIVACPDRGRGACNDPEALGLVLSPPEGLKQEYDLALVEICAFWVLCLVRFVLSRPWMVFYCISWKKFLLLVPAPPVSGWGTVIFIQILVSIITSNIGLNWLGHRACWQDQERNTKIKRFQGEDIGEI